LTEQSIQEILDKADSVLAGIETELTITKVDKTLNALSIPQLDKVVLSLSKQAQKYLEYAQNRIISDREGVKGATEDLSLIANTKKAIEAKRQDYVAPLNAQVKEYNAFFKTLTDPITEADQVTRRKVLDYNREIERQIQEAERIEAEKLKLAQDEMALKGEYTVDLAPVEKPDATPQRVQTDVGTASKMVVWKWEVEDKSLVPQDYLVIDATKVGQVVRASKGSVAIPGIRIFSEDILQVRSR